MTPFPDAIEIVEVGPRDGFQMERSFLPTELKIHLIERLASSGLREIEATSFVSPRVIPQMQDAAAVAAALPRSSHLKYSALVPNVKGAERALASGLDALHVVVAVTETYNQRNVRMSCAQSLEQVRRIVHCVREERSSTPVAATLAVAFGCPFEGQPATERIVEMTQQLRAAGVSEIGLADTAGLGNPLLLRQVIPAVQGALLAASPSQSPTLRLHLHDTRGLGMANVVEGLRLGVRRFDAAFGGLGGCPVMRGASGNIATEDLLYLCEEMNIETGVELDAIRQASLELSEFLERALPSRVLAAGTRADLMEDNRDSRSG